MTEGSGRWRVERDHSTQHSSRSKSKLKKYICI